MIYVLIPSHNEAQTVGLLLWKVRQVFTAFPREYQLLVVDDGSTDGSDELLGPYARALPLTVVTHRERRGYGKSVEELLRLAVARTDRPRRDLAVLLQADFSDSPDAIPELVRRIESGADLALADYRRRRGQTRGAALARRLLARLLHRHRNAGSGMERPLDWVCSLRAIRLVTLARALSERGNRPLLTADGWAADAELLLETARHARRVEVVEVREPALPRRRASRARPLRAAWAAWTLARRRRAPVRATGGGGGPGGTGRPGGPGASGRAAAPSPPSPSPSVEPRRSRRRGRRGRQHPPSSQSSPPHPSRSAATP